MKTTYQVFYKAPDDTCWRTIAFITDLKNEFKNPDEVRVAINKVKKVYFAAKIKVELTIVEDVTNQFVS